MVSEIFCRGLGVHSASCLEIWEPQHPGTSRAFTGITLPYIYIYIYIYINITLPCIYIYIYMYKVKYYMRVCVVGYKLQTVIGKVSLILNSSTKMTKKNDDDVNYKNNSSNRNSKSPC